MTHEVAEDALLAGAILRGLLRVRRDEPLAERAERRRWRSTDRLAIPAAARSLVQETAKAIYRALGCKGLARVDTFLTDDGTVVLNEVNTLPGLTSYSRYPTMMAAAGLPLADVIDRLVTLTLSGKKR